jgi:hypothetical protein
MHWTALIFFTVALSVYAPFAGESSCAEPSCCAQMHSCCGHCHCPMRQSCSVARPVTLDQQAPVRIAQVSPRILVALFTLASFHLSARESERHLVASQPESSPPRASPSPQARLCLWLI